MLDQYITAISNNQGFCCYIGVSNLLESTQVAIIYIPTTQLNTALPKDRIKAASLAVQAAGISSYMEDHEETSKML